MVGGPSEVFASSKAAFFLCGDEPAFTQGLVCGLLARCLMLMLGACPMLGACLMLAGCLLDACLLGLVIAAKGYLESFSVNMFLRKRVLPRM